MPQWIIILVVFIFSVSALDPKVLAKHYTNKLGLKTTIDKFNPPRYEYKETERTCFKYWSFRSTYTDFVMRETLQASNDTTWTVGYVSVPQTRFFNLNNDIVPIHTEEGTWTTRGTTEGWNAAASFQAKGLSISSGYSSLQHESTTNISSLGISEICPSGFECRFETWFYHIDFDGQCQRKAVIQRFEGTDICLWVKPRLLTSHPARAYLAERSECQQYTEWAWKTCWEPNGPEYGSRPVAACKLHLPIQESTTQKQLSTLVFVKEDYRTDPAQTATEVPKATEAADDCVFKLNTGEWYDSFKDTYYNEAIQAWLSQPDRPTPIIDDGLRRPDCPSYKDKSGQSLTMGLARLQAGVAGATNIHKKRQLPQARSIEVKVIAGFRGEI
ncbi:hypothetical protein CDD81_2378 [Ophiocordyceps australis]|uniref:Uncharacterized protein n=1 Tax=Ophiocordyceps australis TaxID=1399860 RepID=A0A2C5X7M6_9HYPO|nr:hypothetical protein CDD81_2378 [Ophiocordyceps australis]